MLNCVLMLQRSSARAVSDSALVRREVSRRREALAAALVVAGERPVAHLHALVRSEVARAREAEQTVTRVRSRRKSA